jgi:hypothetical protein
LKQRPSGLSVCDAIEDGPDQRRRLAPGIITGRNRALDVSLGAGDSRRALATSLEALTESNFEVETGAGIGATWPARHVQRRVLAEAQACAHESCAALVGSRQRNQNRGRLIAGSRQRFSQ